jgi:alkylation response protein AidB-like acyl-CoA dehydrogenase
MTALPADAPFAPAADPVAIADALAVEFAASAAVRDGRGGTAKQERDQLRASGLLTLVVSAAQGGWGAPWSVAMTVVRRLARADSALAHLLGFQYLMLATSRLFGTERQWTHLWGETARRRWFWGNALNPLDRRTGVFGPAGDRRLSGVKTFCSGAVDSDMLIVSAIPAGASRLLVAAIPSDRPGVRILGDWDAFGQRQTDSGTVELHDVLLHDDEVLASPGPLGTPFASLAPVWRSSPSPTSIWGSPMAPGPRGRASPRPRVAPSPSRSPRRR